MNSDSGYKIRLPETTPEGCSVPDGVRSWIEASTIESPTEAENGGGEGNVTPLDFNQLRNQVTNNTNDITGLQQRVTNLENAPSISTGFVSVPSGASSIIFTVPNDGTFLGISPVGGALDNWRLSGRTGSVTLTWDTAVGANVGFCWMQC